MLRMIRGIYATVQACVMSTSGFSDFFECFPGVKQGCILSPVLFSMLMNELANEILEKGKHGVSLGPADHRQMEVKDKCDAPSHPCPPPTVSISLCGRPYFTFVDCNWPQNQLNVLQEATQRLGLTVKLDKSTVVVFRKWF